jgi:hypothetical protein
MPTSDTQTLLRERAREVVAYIRFLKVAVERNATVSAGPSTLRAIHKDLTHTLKANLYLLLYSTVEACMTQLMEDMHRTIAASSAGADDLCSELFLHVLHRFRAGADATEANTARPIQAGIVQRWLSDYSDAVKANRNYLFSGNLDGRSIHDILRKYGVVPAGQPKPNPGCTHLSLQTAKNHRNDLAHGTKSFRELGRTVAVPTLHEEARQVLRTLYNIVQAVDGYLQQQRFLRAPPPTPTTPAPPPVPA